MVLADRLAVASAAPPIPDKDQVGLRRLRAGSTTGAPCPDVEAKSMSFGLLALVAIFIALSVVGVMVRRDGHLHLHALRQSQER